MTNKKRTKHLIKISDLVDHGYLKCGDELFYRGKCKGVKNIFTHFDPMEGMINENDQIEFVINGETCTVQK